MLKPCPYIKPATIKQWEDSVLNTRTTALTIRLKHYMPIKRRVKITAFKTVRTADQFKVILMGEIRFKSTVFKVQAECLIWQQGLTTLKPFETPQEWTL